MWLERSTTMEKMEKLALLGGTPVRATLLPYAHHTIEADDIAAVTETLASDWITQGPAIVRFEKALAARGGARHAVAFANGTAALHAACWAAGLGASDEAITTDRKSTRLNSSHLVISYAVFCLKKKKQTHTAATTSSR